MRAFVSILLFLTIQNCDVTGSGCQGDRNVDDMMRVSCVNQGLTALPGGIEPLTQVLVLTGNRLTSLSWSDYSAFTHLHELDLSHNDITALEPPGPVLENLSVLRLSGNKLIGLGGGVFRCAPKLMKMYLDGNQIRSLHDATFSDLPCLNLINLSGNKLSILPARLLERISSSNLITIDLENNSLSQIPGGFFSSKPELAYIYLSHNPWRCSCSVGYLHSFLINEESSIYKHKLPNDVLPGADSVICVEPPYLRGRPILELEEEEFCATDLDVVVPIVHTPSAPLSTWPAIPSVESWTIQSELYLFSSTESSSESSSATSSEHFTEVLTPDPTADSRSHSSQPQMTSTIPDPPEPLTIALEPLTIAPEPLTIALEPLTIAPEPLTTAPEPLTTAPEPLTTAPEPLTTAPEPLTTAPEPLTTAPEPLTTAPVTARPVRQTSPPSTSDQPNTPEVMSKGSLQTRVVDGRMLPWCWWLFAVFVLLCLLSALTCCSLFLWLLKHHLVLYRTLKRCASRRSDGVTLRAYRRTESKERQGEESEDKVMFLTPEQIKDTRAVFRSVLYVCKEEHEPTSEVQTEANGRDASNTAAEPEKAVMFRKTLYRVISEEHTHNRWTEEEEEERWDQNTERRATRYSLILREETGRQRNVEWLMGEWKMGERGVAYERLCSLIGQEDSTLPFSSSLE